METSTPVKMVSATDIAWMRRRMNTAYDRYTQIVEELDEASRALKTRKLSPVELESYKARKRDLALSKLDAKDDYLQKKFEFTSETRFNYRLRRVGRKDSKEEAKIIGTMDALASEAMTCLKDDVEHLRFLVEQSKRKDFRKKIAALLTESDQARWEPVLRFKTVESGLAKALYEAFKKSNAV